MEKKAREDTWQTIVIRDGAGSNGDWHKLLEMNYYHDQSDNLSSLLKLAQV